MQIVGEICSVCGERITVAPYAVFCKQCEKSFHRTCLEKEDICPFCSRDIQSDLEEAEPEKVQPQHKDPPCWICWSWLGILVAVILFVFFLFSIREVMQTALENIGCELVVDEHGELVTRTVEQKSTDLPLISYFFLIPAILSFVSGFIASLCSLYICGRYRSPKPVCHGVAGLILIAILVVLLLL
jgi:hypothetical protein